MIRFIPSFLCKVHNWLRLFDKRRNRVTFHIASRGDCFWLFAGYWVKEDEVRFLVSTTLDLERVLRFREALDLEIGRFYLANPDLVRGEGKESNVGPSGEF